MKSRRILSGTMGRSDRPDWTALEHLVREELVARFMWMHEVVLEDGARVHAYKDYETREYVHLAEDGRAFDYLPMSGRYHEVDPFSALMRALEGWDGPPPSESEHEGCEVLGPGQSENGGRRPGGADDDDAVPLL